MKDWTTLEELAKRLGTAKANVVRQWREGSDVEMTEDGDSKLWWHPCLAKSDEPSPNGPCEPPADVADEPTELEGSPIHGRTVNALAEHGICTAVDVIAFVASAENRDQASHLLQALDGVGCTGARHTISYAINATGFEFDVSRQPFEERVSGEAESGEAESGEAESGEQLAEKRAEDEKRTVEAPSEWACRSVGKADHDTEEWHQMRAMGVGSSDVGAILGLSPHANIVDVWRSKFPETARDDKPWLDDYSDFGQWMEGHFLDWIREDTGIEIIDGTDLGTLEHVECAHLRANLDGWDPVNGIVEELKTSESSWNSVPLAYFAQVQHQMLITGAHEARVRQFISPVSRPNAISLRDLAKELDAKKGADMLATWLLENGEMVTWVVERDDEFIASMRARTQEFWQCVLDRVEPEIPEPEDTADLSDDEELSELFEVYAEYRTVTDTYKPTQKAADDVKSSIRRAIEKHVSVMGDSPKRLTVGNHKATLVERETHSYWNLYPGDAHVDF